MYKPKNMRLNKFVDVAIPKNSDFFARLNGIMPNIPQNLYTGDDIMPENGRPVDILEDMQAYDKMMQKKEYAKNPYSL